MMLGIKLKTLCLIGKFFTSELYPRLPMFQFELRAVKIDVLDQRQGIGQAGGRLS
jgi:hypothetical protein